MGHTLVKLSESSTVTPEVSPLANNSETVEFIKFNDPNFRFSKKISQTLARKDSSIPAVRSHLG